MLLWIIFFIYDKGWDTFVYLKLMPDIQIIFFTCIHYWRDIKKNSGGWNFFCIFFCGATLKKNNPFSPCEDTFTCRFTRKPLIHTGPGKYIIFQRVGPHAWSHDLSGPGYRNLKYIFMENTIHLRFYMPPSPTKSKKKICTLCYGTGIIQHPKGIKVPCPNGCPGFYPSHRWRGSSGCQKKSIIYPGLLYQFLVMGRLTGELPLPASRAHPTIVIFDTFLQPIQTWS